VKELLKFDIICQSYAQMKKGPVFYDSPCIFNTWIKHARILLCDSWASCIWNPRTHHTRIVNSVKTCTAVPSTLCTTTGSRSRGLPSRLTAKWQCFVTVIKSFCRGGGCMHRSRLIDVHSSVAWRYNDRHERCLSCVHRYYAVLP